MNSWLFQFASDHPFAFVVLCFPLAFTAVGWAWAGTNVASGLFTTFIQAMTVAGNTLVVLIRGYPALMPEPNTSEEDDES